MKKLNKEIENSKCTDMINIVYSKRIEREESNLANHQENVSEVVMEY